MEIKLPCPKIFDFSHILKHLDRSPLELLHRVENEKVWKCVMFQGKSLVFSVEQVQHFILIRTSENLNTEAEEYLSYYVRDWFDLDRDLEMFYKQVADDPLLSPIITRFHGLRLVKVSDLFEALSWAILGQQINLSFAYTLKKRLIEQFGQKCRETDKELWFFPKASIVKNLQEEQFHALSISKRKTEYLQELARHIDSGTLTKDLLLKMDSCEEIEKYLCKIRGIGAWTAQYVLMRCLGHPEAYPVGDAGLQNAVKHALGSDRKPSQEELYSLAKSWKGWEAYATFYLWNSLS